MNRERERKRENDWIVIYLYAHIHVCAPYQVQNRSRTANLQVAPPDSATCQHCREKVISSGFRFIQFSSPQLFAEVYYQMTSDFTVTDGLLVRVSQLDQWLQGANVALYIRLLVQLSVRRLSRWATRGVTAANCWTPRKLHASFCLQLSLASFECLLRSYNYAN